MHFHRACVLSGHSFVMQQDNDHKHSSKLYRSFLENKEVGVLKNMVWPPQSSDRKPTELLREELDGGVRGKCPTLNEEMWRMLTQSWNNISSDTVNKLISSYA